jgi:diguanylate cyclase (GGDEF)-like protein
VKTAEEQRWHWLRRLVHRHGVWTTVCVMTLIAIVYSVLVGVALDLLLKPAVDWLDLVYCVVIPALVAPLVSYASIRLLHDLELAERKLHQLATKDSLTGLGTRRHFLELAEWTLEKSRRSGQAVSVLMMDADNFKQINDTLGRAAGDRVLAAIGKVIHNVCRTADLAGRYGGEEFAILLPATPTAMAVAVAERLRVRLRLKWHKLPG